MMTLCLKQTKCHHEFSKTDKKKRTGKTIEKKKRTGKTTQQEKQLFFVFPVEFVLGAESLLEKMKKGNFFGF